MTARKITLILFTEKSNPDHTDNLTDSSWYGNVLEPVQKTVARLQEKRRDAARMRRAVEREGEAAKSAARRARSGIAAAERRIEAANEDLSEASLLLNQKIAQRDSTLRLIEAAKRHLDSEADAKAQAEQDAGSAGTEDERAAAQRRLRGVQEKTSEIKFEIKSRKKLIKKLESEIDGCSSARSRIAAKIKKAGQAKPELKRILKSSTADSERLSLEAERISRREAGIKKSLKRAVEKLKAQPARRRRPAAKKRSATRRAASKRPAGKTAKKTRSGSRRTAAKKPARRTAKRTSSGSKRTSAKKPSKRIPKRTSSGSKRIAKKPARRTAKKPARRTAKKPARRTAKKPARRTAKKPARRTAKKPARRTAKKPARRTAKKPARRIPKRTSSGSRRTSAKRPAKKPTKR